MEKVLKHSCFDLMRRGKRLGTLCTCVCVGGYGNNGTPTRFVGKGDQEGAVVWGFQWASRGVDCGAALSPLTQRTPPAWKIFHPLFHFRQLTVKVLVMKYFGKAAEKYFRKIINQYFLLKRFGELGLLFFSTLCVAVVRTHLKVCQGLLAACHLTISPPRPPGTYRILPCNLPAQPCSRWSAFRATC